MKKITLIGKKQAKVGHKFVFNQSINECEKCKLKHACMDNLEIGRVYEIIEVRSKEHPCDVFEDNVIIVVVELSDIKALIQAKGAFEGAIIKFNLIEDNDISDNLLKYKNPIGLKSGDKCKIIKILKTDKKSKFKLAHLGLIPVDSF